jgi:hypothetical protein
MRDLWQTTNITYGANLGFATFPKKLKSSGVKRIIERALWEQGLRKPLARGEKRHEWKAAHGFRKFYKTRAEQAMKPINVEITMGHNIGLSSSYYRPTEREVLEDYLRAVDLLTISNSHYKLEKQIDELKQQQSKPQQSSGQEDITQKLQKLANLKQQGLITEEEYQKSKADLLAKL